MKERFCQASFRVFYLQCANIRLPCRGRPKAAEGGQSTNKNHNVPDQNTKQMHVIGDKPAKRARVKNKIKGFRSTIY